MSYEIDQLSPPLLPSEMEDIATLTDHLTGSTVPRDVIEANVTEIVSNLGQLLFVARDTARIVGMSLITLKTLPHERTAYGDSLIVHPDFRGFGIAKLLKQATCEYADEHGITLQGTTNPRRIAAFALHQQFGAEVWDTRFLVRRPRPVGGYK